MTIKDVYVFESELKCVISLCADDKITAYLNMARARAQMLIRRYEKRGTLLPDTHAKTSRRSAA